MIQDYKDKGADYVARARCEIEPLLEPRAIRALEIGCGEGETMRWLKETGRVDHGWGLELFEFAAVSAREQFEEVLVGDAEPRVPSAFEGLEFDLIL